MMNEKFVLFEDLGIQKGRNLLSVHAYSNDTSCMCVQSPRWWAWVL